MRLVFILQIDIKKKLKGKYEICGDKKRKTPWFVINGKG